jgi:hypothetical protein
MNILGEDYKIHFVDEIENFPEYEGLCCNETKMIYCNECQKEFTSSCAFYYHCKGCMDFNKNDEKYKKFEEITA